MTPFLELGVVLAAVAVAGAVAVRLGQSVVPAYIVAGIVVGPHAPTDVAGVPIALVAESEFVAVFADLGVVLLLFFLGLHVDADRLLGDWDRVVGAGVVDLGCNAAAGVVLGWLFGFSLLETLFLVGVVYISSSAVVTKALLERGWIANRESEPILGSLVFEDVVDEVYRAVLSTLVLGGSASGALVGLAAGFALLAGVAVTGWYATGAIERLVAARSNELFLLRVLAVAVLVAGVAATLGVSKGIAAFFVGAALGATDEAERVERALVSVRDLFAATFFFAVGLATPVSGLVDGAGLLAAAIVATTASKLVSGVVSGRIYGLDDRRSLRVGLGLVARGEFSLVLAALARAAPTPVGGVPEFAVGYVLATSVLGTLLLRHESTVAELAGVADRAR